MPPAKIPTKRMGLNTKGASADNPNRKIPKKQKAANMRDKGTINRLNMYRNSGAIRNKEGKVVGGSLMMAGRQGGITMADATASSRIAPDRRWFGNTRVVGQKELDKFRNEMNLKAADPYSVVLRTRKLPMGLIQDSTKVARMKLLETETFEETFGKQRTRKRAKLNEGVGDLESLVSRAATQAESYENKGVDSNIEVQVDFKDAKRNDVFNKGQSKRIWGELYKVLDCSDVVIQVLDARNVPGTRNNHIEHHLGKNASHKHLIYVINKCNLVPNWVTKKWVQILSKTTPTLAFHASLNAPFGKGALINLLRQFAKLHQEKKQISVGIMGYPNVGKSSVINALRKKRVCALRSLSFIRFFDLGVIHCAMPILSCGVCGVDILAVMDFHSNMPSELCIVSFSMLSGNVIRMRTQAHRHAGTQARTHKHYKRNFWTPIFSYFRIIFFYADIRTDESVWAL